MFYKLLLSHTHQCLGIPCRAKVARNVPFDLPSVALPHGLLFLVPFQRKVQQSVGFIRKLTKHFCISVLVQRADKVNFLFWISYQVMNLANKIKIWMEKCAFLLCVQGECIERAATSVGGPDTKAPSRLSAAPCLTSPISSQTSRFPVASEQAMWQGQQHTESPAVPKGLHRESWWSRHGLTEAKWQKFTKCKIIKWRKRGILSLLVNL